jgi:hypothetical protein
MTAKILSREQIEEVSGNYPGRKLRAWIYHLLLYDERLSCIYRNKLRSPEEMALLCNEWVKRRRWNR